MAKGHRHTEHPSERRARSSLLAHEERPQQLWLEVSAAAQLADCQWLTTRIRHNNKLVDLALSFRHSGLTSGAKLELITVSKSPSVVSVALQHPDSTRQTDKFPSNTTLWLILRKFESDPAKNINVTARGVAKADGSSGRMYYETPVLNIMGREFSNFSGELQKTLAQIGFNSGSVLIRLHYRATDVPLEEAITSIGGYFKETEEGDAANAPPAPQDTQPVSAALEAAEQSEPQRSSDTAVNESDSADTGPPTPMHIDEAAPQRMSPSLGPDQVAVPTQSPITVFAPPSGTVPQAAKQEVDDSDFEPSVYHAKLHQSRLETASQNRKLLPYAELEAIEQEKKAKKAAVKETQIRVRFPDQTQVTFPITTAYSGASLFEFVRGLIVHPDQPFEIVYRGPKNPKEKIPDSNSVYLIKDMGFRVPTLVNFNWRAEVPDSVTRQPPLKEEYRAQAKPVHVPEPVKTEREVEEPAPKAKEKKPVDAKSKEEKLKSLFGLGKKK